MAWYYSQEYYEIINAYLDSDICRVALMRTVAF